MNPWEVVFGGIERALGSALAGIYAVVPSFGVAIILLTIGIRVALYPITSRATRSMYKMQMLAPQIKELQQRYKDDRAKLSEAQMALYRANKVSPVSGCLPLLIQMPFLWAMYRVIGSGRRSGLEAGAFLTGLYPEGSALFKALGTTSLVAPASAVVFLGINLGVSPMQAIRLGPSIAYAIPQLVLVALIIATGFFQQRQMRTYRAQRGTETRSQPMQAVGRVMPLAFGVFSMLWPAGLNLYWLTSNLFQIGQQHLILHKYKDEIVIPESVAANGTERPSKPEKRSKQKPSATQDQLRTNAHTRAHPTKKTKSRVPQRVPPKSRRKSAPIEEDLATGH